MNNYNNNLNLTQSLKSTSKKKSGFIPSSNLILFAFATAFFSRIVDFAGAPSIINFFHFICIPAACIITLLTNINRNKQSIKNVDSIILGLFILLTLIIVSALVNEAGIINVLLDFMLLAEPFVFLISIIYLPLTLIKLNYLKKWFHGFFWAHLFLVFVQKYILRTDTETWEWVGMEGADRIQGVFFVSGAGHVVGSSVSLTFALYYLLMTKKPLWLRIIAVLAAFWNVVLADGKQALLAFMVAMILLFFIKLNDIVVASKYIVSGTILGSMFWWGIQNIKALSAFNTWIRPGLYGPDGEATLLKLAPFRIIPTHYESVLNWFFGLGPGHTVGRLGGWMLPKYNELLAPLGSTIHAASKDIWFANRQSWLGDQSSMFSPLFGWAGIWGDLGLFGLAAYLYLGFIVWKHICVNDLMKFFLLTIVVFGCIFSQLEEPGYMLTVACILGMQYQEHVIRKTQHNLSSS